MIELRRRRAGARHLVVATAVMLTAMACGSTTTDNADSGDAGGGGLDRSFVLGSIEPLSGSNVLTQYINGVRMAVDDVNEAGGINGHEIVLKEYDNQLDAQKAVAAARLAVSDGVDAVIGMPSTITNNAAAPILQQADILYLNAGVSTPVASNQPLGGSTTFRLMTPMSELIYADAQYVINELQPRSIGLMGLGIDYGKNALPQFEEAFKDAGIKVVSQKLYPYDTTNLTNEILSMEGAEAILDWSYPNQMALGIRTAIQHGFGDVPYIGGPSSSIVNSRALVPASAQDTVYGVQACSPTTDSRQYVQEWAQRYQEQYNEPPNYAAPAVYDGVFLLKAALEKAGSFEADAIAEALDTITYTDNTVCGTTYQSDDLNQMMHEAVVMSFENGQPKQEKLFKQDELVEHGRTG